MKLNAQTVNDTFSECLFREGETTEKYIVGEAVKMKVGFHPERLKNKELLIEKMLKDLPDDFQKDGGGGMSFLNMCNNKEGIQWTGFHQTMDQLVALGIATGKLSFLIPKEMWGILPGGMPYLVVN